MKRTIILASMSVLCLLQAAVASLEAQIKVAMGN